MDSLYFEPLDLSVTILTAPTGWSGAAELCAIREASTNYYILGAFKIFLSSCQNLIFSLSLFSFMSTSDCLDRPDLKSQNS